MAEQQVLDALKATLLGPSFQAPGVDGHPLVGDAYIDIPQFPYQGRYPFVILAPETQYSEMIEPGTAQQHGMYSIIYFDQLGEHSGLTVNQIVSNARSFFTALRAAVHSDTSLGGAVQWAGFGEGIVVHWDEAERIMPHDGEPLYCVPCSIHVLLYAEPAPYPF